MYQQKKYKVVEAKWLEWDKKRFSFRFKMLQLQEDIITTREYIKFHEEEVIAREGSDVLKINKDIINLLNKQLKVLLKQASEV